MRDQNPANIGPPASVPPIRERRKTDRRLDTWKEIGAFFGRDERTVKRWETSRNLPVHRVPGTGRATVYAYASELESWLSGAEAELAESVPAATEGQPPAEIMAPAEEASQERISVPAQAVEADRLDIQAEELTATSAELISGPPDAQTGHASRRHPYMAAILLASALGAACLAIAGYRYFSPVSHAPTHTTKHPVDPEAREFFLKGEYYLQKRTPESLNLAVDNYTQAIVRDPAYAQAYAGLADCYNLLREYTLMPASEAYPRALAAAKQAVALDDSLAGAHSALAFADFFWLWHTADAEREFQRAIALDPNSVSAHHWYATFLFHLGRFPEALEEINRAQMLDPASISVLADKGLILSYADRSEEGIALLKQLQAAEPSYLSPPNYLAKIYLNEGNYAGYLTESEAGARLVRDQDRLSVTQAGTRGFRHRGAEGMFEAMLARQLVLYGQGRASAFSLAEIYSRLGQRQEALSYLRISCTRREQEMAGLRIDPCLRGLHGEPEYEKLLAEAGFPATRK